MCVLPCDTALACEGLDILLCDTPKRFTMLTPNRTLVVFEHEGRLDHVRQCGHLHLAEHELEEREDTLCSRRVGCERADDLHGESPRRKQVAVVGPEEEHVSS